MKSNITVHVGYPKCGSSFLQNIIFPRITDVYFFDKYVHLFSRFNNGDKVLISNENIVGEPLQELTFKYFADIIINRYNSPNIILIRRNKASLIYSYYCELVMNGMNMRFNKFINNYKDAFVDFLDYDKVIGYYKDHGCNVLVLDFEDLQKDNKNFVNCICNFINVDTPDYENIVVRKKKTRFGINCRVITNKLFDKLKL